MALLAVVSESTQALLLLFAIVLVVGLVSFLFDDWLQHRGQGHTTWTARNPRRSQRDFAAAFARLRKTLRKTGAPEPGPDFVHLNPEAQAVHRSPDVRVPGGQWGALPPVGSEGPTPAALEHETVDTPADGRLGPVLAGPEEVDPWADALPEPVADGVVDRSASNIDIDHDESRQHPAADPGPPMAETQGYKPVRPLSRWSDSAGNEVVVLHGELSAEVVLQGQHDAATGRGVAVTDLRPRGYVALEDGWAVLATSLEREVLAGEPVVVRTNRSKGA